MATYYGNVLLSSPPFQIVWWSFILLLDEKAAWPVGTGHTLFVITGKVATKLLSCDEWSNDRGLTGLLPELILDITRRGSIYYRCDQYWMTPSKVKSFRKLESLPYGTWGHIPLSTFLVEIFLSCTASYIVCGVQCKIKMWVILFKKWGRGLVLKVLKYIDFFSSCT